MAMVGEDVERQLGPDFEALIRVGATTPLDEVLQTYSSISTAPFERRRPVLAGEKRKTDQPWRSVSPEWRIGPARSSSNSSEPESPQVPPGALAARGMGSAVYVGSASRSDGAEVDVVRGNWRARALETA